MGDNIVKTKDCTLLDFATYLRLGDKGSTRFGLLEFALVFSCTLTKVTKDTMDNL